MAAAARIATAMMAIRSFMHHLPYSDIYSAVEICVDNEPDQKISTLGQPMRAGDS
jgi:hypothetical protein